MAENYLCSLPQVISPGSAVSGTNRRPWPLPRDASPVWTCCMERVSVSLFFQFIRNFNIPDVDTWVFEISHALVLSLRERMQNKLLLSSG